MKKEHFTVSHTVNVSYSKAPDQDCKQLILALHGHGMNADRFIQKFKSYFCKSTLVVCPEGRHRYYKQGVNGSVVAHWMTKELREADIANNNQYLEQLTNSILEQAPNIDQIVLIGFSQGGALAQRWATFTRHKLDQILIWGAEMNPDFKENETFSNQIPFRFIIGNKDPYFNPERFNNLKTSLPLFLPKSSLHCFNGQHSILLDELVKHVKPFLYEE